MAYVSKITAGDGNTYDIKAHDVYSIKNASGTIASFNDGADDVPIVNGVFNITATQAGTGDPSPNNNRVISGFTGMTIYKTGANVWDEQMETGSIDSSNGQNVSYGTDRMRSKNYIAVKPNSTYYFCSVNSVGCQIFKYDKNKTYLGVLSSNINISISIPSDCYYIRFRTADNYGTSYNTDFSINYPSTDTSYHPYIAVNIWDEQWEFGSISTVDGSKVAADSTIRTKNNIYVKQNTKISIVKGTGFPFYILFYDTNGIAIQYVQQTGDVAAYNMSAVIDANATNATFTTPSNTAYILIRFNSMTSYSGGISVSYPSIAVDWTDEAGIVYNGMLNTTTGELTATWAGVVLDENSGTWQFQSAFQQGYVSDVLQDAPAKYEYRTVSHLCDKLKPVSNNSRGNNLGNFSSLISSGLGVGLSCSAESLEDFITWITNNPVTFVYELETPITYQLSPIEIKTLLGVNNIFCDTGNTSVNYICNSEIEQAINHMVNAKNTKVYVSGTTLTVLNGSN